MTDRSSCSVESDVLSAFMDEELPDERMKELREHVRDCGRCGDRLSRLREAQRAARTVEPPSTPDTFVSDVRERIEQETTQSHPEMQEVSSSPNLSEDATGTDDPDDGLGGHTMGLAAAAVLLLGISVGLFFTVEETRRKQEKQVAKGNRTRSESTQGGMESSEMETGQEEETVSSSSVLSDEGATDERSDVKRSKDGSGSGVKSDHTEEAAELEKKNQKAKIESSDNDPIQSGDARDWEDQNRASHQVPSEMDLSPLLVRLPNSQGTVLDDLVSALSVVHPDHVKLRAWIPANGQETGVNENAPASSSGSTEKEAGTTWREVKNLSLDVSAEQLSDLLKQNATFELIIRQDEAKLFLGALVQQGQSPVVLTTKPEKIGGMSQFSNAAPQARSLEESDRNDETEADEASSDDASDIIELRRTLVSLQQSNLRLQETRTAWSEESKSESGSAATSDAISIPTLRRFLQRYQSDDNEQKGEQDHQYSDADRQAGQRDESSAIRANERRRVLRDWVTFLEDRPSSWSATAPEKNDAGQASQTPGSDQKQNAGRQKQSLDSFLDVRLHVQPERSPSENPDRRTDLDLREETKDK